MNAQGSIDHFRRQWQTHVAAAEYDVTYPAERPRNQWQLLERIKADLMRDLLVKEGHGPGSTVLECGCGAAGIGIDLGLQGWRVTGLDKKPTFVQLHLHGTFPLRPMPTNAQAGGLRYWHESE